MSYELEAILGRQAVLHQHRDRYREARVAPLEDGWAIIPLTASLKEELSLPIEKGISDPSAADEDIQPRLTAWLEEISRDGAVAQIESECFGGVCGDAATVWRDGKIVLGSLRGGELNEDFGTPLVINQVLRFMGFSVDSSKLQAPMDEFDAVGLGRHRKTEQW